MTGQVITVDGGAGLAARGEFDVADEVPAL
jgi:hypothetical protein